MTDKHTQRRTGPAKVRTAAAAVLAIMVAGVISAPSSANDVRGAASTFRTLEDQRRPDVTVVIIDKDDRNSRSGVSGSSSSTSAPASKVRRDNDRTKIYINGNSNNRQKTAKPKVIIVDKNRNRNGCSGSGVCVIRP